MQNLVASFRIETSSILDQEATSTVKANQANQEPKATWVEPQFYADVEYRDITSDGLRASSFKGLIKGTERT